MTDVSTTPVVTGRRVSLPRPSFPKLEFGASLRAVFGLFSDALNMAYVSPYTGLRRQPQIVPDDDLEGRDPSW